jgi:hypothetical protein
MAKRLIRGNAGEKKREIVYRKYNFRASETRVKGSCNLHPDLLDGLQKIADSEGKSLCWLIEYALADYFGILVMLRKLKGKPRPSLMARDNIYIAYGKNSRRRA